MRSISALLFVVLVASTTDAFSQAKSLTLAQAVGVALEQNISVVQAQNNVDAAQSGVLAAYGSYLPSLSASASGSRYQFYRLASSPTYFNGIILNSGSPAFSATSNYQVGVNLYYTIFNGFSREGAFNKATSGAVATEQTSLRTRQSTVYQVQSAYVTVLKNEQLVNVNQENLKRDQQQLERIEESSKVGALAVADVYRQQSQVATDEFALISAQNTFDKSKADLLALIGLDLSVDYVIADPSITPELSDTEIISTRALYNNFNDLTSRALVARPDYKSAKETLSADESGVTMARGGYFPSISASAGYGLSNPELAHVSDNKNLNWGLNFTWTIFDGFNTNYQVQSAIAIKRNAEIALVQTERSVGVDVKKALLDLDAAGKQYDVSLKALVSANQDRKIATEKYNLGAGTLLDLLVANANLVNAEANKITAAYGFVVAKVNVEYVIGERAY